MIIIRIHGGLGNQMFQYALGRNLSLTHSVPLKIDSSYLKETNQSGRSFQLDGLAIKVEEANEAEIASYCGPLQKLLDRFRPERLKKRVFERAPWFEAQILRRSDGYFDGHWQSERYFHPHEAEIRKDFGLKKPLGQDAQKIESLILSEPQPVSLHIRRGDYVSIPKVAGVHGVLPLSYYEEAVKKMLEKFPQAGFFVFSDDIGWAKENFPKNYRVAFVSSPAITDHEEMLLMSRCQNHIIANSTFSWWGAWLNQNPEKTVIAPRQWFKDSARKEYLTLQSWIHL